MEQFIDRRFNEFEKLMDTRLTNFQGGLDDMRSTMNVLVTTVSTMHKEYTPREESNKDNAVRDEKVSEVKQDISDMKRKIDRLYKWQYTATGAIIIVAFILGLVSHMAKLW